MEHSPIRGMVFPSSHNGCIAQHVQVSYAAHVTPIPENLDSVLLPRRILTITCKGCQCIPHVEVQPNKSRRTGLELAAASDILVRTTLDRYYPYLIFTVF
jgi:hypothetical protein